MSQHSDLSPTSSSSLQMLQQASSLAALSALHDSNFSSNSSSEGGGRASPPPRTQLTSPATTPVQFKVGPSTPPGYVIDSPASTPMDLSSEECNDLWPRYIMHYPSNTACMAGMKCTFYQADHFHCKDPTCEMPLR